MRRIEPKSSDVPPDERVAAAARPHAETSHHTRVGGLGRDRLNEVFIGPAAFRSAASVGIGGSRSRPREPARPALARHV